MIADSHPNEVNKVPPEVSPRRLDRKSTEKEGNNDEFCKNS